MAKGVTVALPFAQATVPTLLSMAQLVAFAMPLHDNVTGSPALMLAGLAANEPMDVPAGTTENVCGALVPPAVVTVTLLWPIAAAESIVNVAVADAALATTTLLTATPPPLTVTLVEPTTKFVAASVTVTVAPCAPLAGEILLRVGEGVEGAEGFLHAVAKATTCASATTNRLVPVGRSGAVTRARNQTDMAADSFNYW